MWTYLFLKQNISWCRFLGWLISSNSVFNLLHGLVKILISKSHVFTRSGRCRLSYLLQDLSIRHSFNYILKHRVSFVYNVLIWANSVIEIHDFFQFVFFDLVWFFRFVLFLYQNLILNLWLLFNICIFLFLFILLKIVLNNR